MPINSPWASVLQPASFKNIPFEVTDTEYEFSRCTVTHEFPMSEAPPMVEDLGLGTQHIKISGFLCGDDCYDQRDALTAITQQQGQGELVHPSLGSLTCALITAGFSESIRDGRSIGISLTFVVTADPADSTTSWQDISSSTPDFIQAAVTNVQAALGSDFISQVQSGIQQGAAVVNGVVSQVNGYVSQVQSVIGDASRIVHSVDGLTNLISGQVGSRYAIVPTGAVASAAIGGVLATANQQIGNANKLAYGVTGLINVASQGYSDVMGAASSVNNLVAQL